MSSDEDEDELQMALEEEEDEEEVGGDESYQHHHGQVRGDKHASVTQASAELSSQTRAISSTAGIDVNVGAEQHVSSMAMADLDTIDLDNAELVEEDLGTDAVFTVMQSSASSAPANVVADKSHMTNRKFLESMIIRLPTKAEEAASGTAAKSAAGGQVRRPRPGKGAAIPRPQLSQKQLPVTAKSLASDGAHEAVKKGMPKLGSDTIVLQPGSMNLVLSLGSDLQPKIMPNVIAWRVSKRTQNIHGHNSHRRHMKDSSHQREEAYSVVDQEIRRDQSKRDAQSAKLRPPVPTDEIRKANALAGPKIISSDDDRSSFQWTDVSSKPKFIIGNAALKINQTEPYELFFPINGGSLLAGDGRSERVSFEDSVRIWAYAIEHLLGIPRNELMNYKILVLVPDLFKRKTVSSMLSIALDELRFAAAFCHQESVCTSFGAGLQSAAIINIGHTSTSICCVDDGTSIPESRIRLKYGVDDILRSFYWLVEKINFPYKDCDLGRWADVQVLRKLVHRLCHINIDDYNIRNHEFFVRDGDGLKQFQFKLNDQPIAAVMGLFYPSFFGISSAEEELVLQHRDKTILSEDSVYSTTTEPEFQILMKTKNDALRGTEIFKKPSGQGTNQNIGNKADTNDQIGPSDQKRQKLAHPPTLPGTAPSSSTDSVNADYVAVLKHTEKESKLEFVGIDEAVTYSISKCATETVKKNMYQSVLLVGGGAIFSGLPKMMEMRLKQQMPVEIRRVVERVNVITQPKNRDSRFVAWKGATILAQLTAIQDAWILQSEWEELGPRVAREKALFAW